VTRAGLLLLGLRRSQTDVFGQLLRKALYNTGSPNNQVTFPSAAYGGAAFEPARHAQRIVNFSLN